MINWLSEKLVPKYKPNKKEQLILNIVQNLCDQADTDIKMAPISERYYIVNKRLEYWIRVYSDGISITNHKFTFSNHAPQTYQMMLVKIIQSTIEKHRNEFETTIFQNEIEMLENICENIKNK
jgi:hypothetical protein